MPSTGLESIDGVITKFLQDKDSLHCIALFNVTQLYENLKTNKKQNKTRQNIINSTTLNGEHVIFKELAMFKLVLFSVKGQNKRLHMECKL